jgi:hypothetical protein
LGIIYKLLEGSRGDGKEVVHKKDKIVGGKGGEGGWRIVIPMPEALMAAGKNGSSCEFGKKNF